MVGDSDLKSHFGPGVFPPIPEIESLVEKAQPDASAARLRKAEHWRAVARMGAKLSLTAPAPSTTRRIPAVLWPFAYRAVLRFYLAQEWSAAFAGGRLVHYRCSRGRIRC
jgi:hypothetical protein